MFFRSELRDIYLEVSEKKLKSTDGFDIEVFVDVVDIALSTIEKHVQAQMVNPTINTFLKKDYDFIKLSSLFFVNEKLLTCISEMAKLESNELMLEVNSILNDWEKCFKSNYSFKKSKNFSYINATSSFWYFVYHGFTLINFDAVNSTQRKNLTKFFLESLEEVDFVNRIIDLNRNFYEISQTELAQRVADNEISGESNDVKSICFFSIHFIYKIIKTFSQIEDIVYKNEISKKPKRPDFSNKPS